LIRLNIRLADNNDKDRWDDFVKSHPHASPYHLYAWKMAVEEAYNHRACYFIAENNNKVTGVLPLIYLKPPLITGQLVSLPYCDIGDMLATQENTKERLISEAISLAKKTKAKYIEIRGQINPPSFGDPGLPVSVQAHKVRMILEVPPSSETLWNNFRSKLRSQVRKTEKNGLRFVWGEHKDVDSFYVVFSRNMRDLGSPVHSKRWFKAILLYYGSNARMGLVYYSKQLIGAGIILCINNSISVPWASTLQEYNRLSPNMLLYWEFIKYASDNGFVKFDFGRSTPNEGTYKFKEQWGAQPVPLYWNYINICRNDIKFNAPDIAGRNTVARIWQKLPLGIANRIGPVIRKHISL
jgi:FemAB-related protein (PEP-CTERM system-associated)